MANPIIWEDTIAQGDLGTSPTAVSDPNVLVKTANKADIVLSGDLQGGTTPTMTVTTYYYDALAAAFFLTGDQFVLDPAASNLAVMNPNGLILGFTATVTGGPSSYALNVGNR